jgi:hypothetical protein
MWDFDRWLDGREHVLTKEVDFWGPVTHARAEIRYVAARRGLVVDIRIAGLGPQGKLRVRVTGRQLPARAS